MTLERLQPLLDVLLVLGFCSSRITGFCSVSVFFASQYLTGIARRALILALSLVIMPPLFGPSLALLHDNRELFVLFLIKEVFIGVIFGWLTNFLFYVAQSVGFIIDTQRGASMASLFDPISNSQTSPLGDFLMKFTLTLAITCGGLLLFLEGLYFSYEKVPVLTPYKTLPPTWNAFFTHAMGGQLFHLLVLLGGPVLFILFLSEFGLGLVTRFAPQLNVFFLSMPIKSELALLFLKGLYFSYEKLPVLTPYKALPPAWNAFFIHAMGGQLFHRLVLLGGPVLFILFLAEFGLGLVTRFAPQLNVFFLSMPIKSELAMLFFILYLSHLMHYFCTHFGSETRTEIFLKFLTG